MMRTPSKRRCSCRREKRTWTGLKPLVVLGGSATKKKELCFVVGDVRRKQPRAQSVNEDLKGGGCRKTKEGNNTKGEDVTLFLPSSINTERCRERDRKKKTKERERDEKI